MYKRHKIVLTLTFIISSVIFYFASIEISEALLSSMLTVLSITFGLTITAITSLNGTTFIKRISTKIDMQGGIKRNGVQTLKHYFKVSCTSNLLVLVVLLIVFAFFNKLVLLPSILFVFIGSVSLSGVILCLVLSSLIVSLLLEALAISNQ